MSVNKKSRFNVTPYYDDFDEANKFLQVLFKPGFALQARELTQLQTILNNQIGRFGDHIFEEGTVVQGGGITERKVKFIRIDPATSTSFDVEELVGFEIEYTHTIQSPLIPEQEIDELVGQKTTVSAKVIHTLDDTSTDGYKILFIEVIKGTLDDSVAFDSGTTSITTTNPLLNATLTIVGDATEGIGTIPHTGEAILVSIDQGIFYTDNFFVLNDAQTLPVYEEENGIRVFNPDDRTVSVGFSINREIASPETDSSLRDPSQGSYNYNAPGADRYLIDLKISQIPYIFDESGYRTDFSTEDYFEFARIIKGQTFKKLKYPEYAKLEETLARRTYDESGHYTVVPFGINTQDYNEIWDPEETGRIDPYNYVAIGMESGKAYVRGFEFELQNTEHLLGKRSRHYRAVNDRLVDVDLGNYVLVEHNLDGTTPLFYGETGMMNGDSTSQLIGKEYKKVYLTIDPGSGILEPVGCARIYHIAKDSTGVGELGVGVLYRVYLTDISFGGDAGFSSEYNSKTIKDVTYISDPNTNKTICKLYDADLGLKEEGKTDLFFKVPEGDTIKTVTGLDYYIQTDFTVDLTEISGVWTGTVTAPPGSLFQGNVDDVINDVTNLDEYLVSVDGYLFDMSTGSIGAYGGNTLTTESGNAQLKIEIGSSASDSWTGTKKAYLLANLRNNHDDVFDNNHYHRKKVLMRHTVEITNNTNADNSSSMWNSRLGGGRGINLGYSDIFMIESVTELGTNKDYTDMFTLNNGQLPHRYDWGSIVLDSGQAGGTAGPDNAWVEAGAGFKIQFLYFDHQRWQLGYDVTDHSTVLYPATVNSYIHSDHQIKEFNNGGETATFVQESTDVWAEPNEFTTYNYIPSYTNPKSGETVNLTDVIDFRPIKVGGWDVSASDAGKVYGVYTPQDGKLFFSDYEHYVSRVDKLILTKDREFKILEGIPSTKPVPPEHNPEEAMVLYLLYWNPYTVNAEDVSTEYIDNQRFTMEQIGELSERVTKLEEVTQLSVHEADAKSQSGAYGKTIFMNAMVVDSFYNTESVDIDNPDHNVSIDPDTGTLRPATSLTNINLIKSPILSSSGVTGSSDNLYTLEPSRVDISTVNNLDANVSVPVNPFEKSNWVGNLKLSPSSDDWFDMTRNPAVMSNVDGSKDPYLIRLKKKNKGIRNGWGAFHNWWYRNWLGNSRLNLPRRLRKQFLTNRFKVPANQMGVVRERTQDRRWWKYRSGEQRLDELAHNNINLNSRKEQTKGRTVDKGIIPFVRQRTITCNATGMRPNSKYYVFVDGVRLSTSETSAVQSRIAWITSKSNYGRTDKNGNAEVTIKIPQNSKYRAGKLLIRICDSMTNSVADTTTVAENFYVANGLVKSVNEKITSTREISAKRDSARKERITQDAASLSKKQVLSDVADYFDAMAQKFVIDADKFPRGIFATSIDLFFQKADDKELPFSIELRPVVNNVPHPTTTIPLSEVVVDANDCVVSSKGPNSENHTRFNFTSPIFLESGEYAIIFKTNSSKYRLWASEFGKKGITADGTSTINDVSKQPYIGPIFEPQNNGERKENTNSSLMFRLNRAKYDTGVSNAGVLYLVGEEDTTINSDGEVVSTPKAHEVTLMSEYIKDPLTEITFNVDDMDSTVELQPNTTVKLSKRNEYDLTLNKELVRATLTTEDEILTPVLDVDRLSLIAAKNEISLDTTDEIKASAPTKNEGFARYIGKQVRMDTKGNILKVVLDASIPHGTNVKVYAKYLRENEDVIENKEWFELDPETNYNPVGVGENNFYEYVFSFTDTDQTLDHGFVSFMTKVVLTGDDSTSDIPQAKKLKTYSLYDVSIAPLTVTQLAITGVDEEWQEGGLD
jgi:hypothetical protein